MKRVFIDLGAFNGDTLEMAIWQYPNLDEYIGFEPEKQNFNYLEKRFKGNNKVNVYKEFAGIKNRKITLYCGNDLKGTSKFPHPERTKIQRVTEINFSEFLKDNFSKKDYIILKMDIEGAEYSLFKKLIKTGAIKLISELFVDWHDWAVGYWEHGWVVLDLQQNGFRLNGDITDEFKYKHFFAMLPIRTIFKLVFRELKSRLIRKSHRQAKK